VATVTNQHLSAKTVTNQQRTLKDLLDVSMKPISKLAYLCLVSSHHRTRKKIFIEQIVKEDTGFHMDE